MFFFCIFLPFSFFGLRRRQEPRDLVSLTHYFHCISWLYLNIAEQLEWESESKVWIEYVHILRGSSRHKFALLTLLIDSRDCLVGVLRVVEWTWKVFQFCKFSVRYSDFHLSSPRWLRTRCVSRVQWQLRIFGGTWFCVRFFSLPLLPGKYARAIGKFQFGDAMLIVTGDVDDEEKSQK